MDQGSISMILGAAQKREHPQETHRETGKSYTIIPPHKQEAETRIELETVGEFIEIVEKNNKWDNIYLL